MWSIEQSFHTCEHDSQAWPLDKYHYSANSYSLSIGQSILTILGSKFSCIENGFFCIYYTAKYTLYKHAKYAKSAHGSVAQQQAVR